jgi:multicomponent Na+:H+ antiporter subunit A
MLTGSLATLGQRDMKRVLAYSTLAVLGTLVMLIGVGTAMAIKTAVVYLVAHGLYKAALFMVAGNVDHETGTRELRQLGGLRRFMPWTALAGILAALSKAGAPPMFGFIGKEMLYKTKLDLEAIGAWAVVASVVANVALVASALMVSVWPFLGRTQETPRKPHEAPLAMLLGAVLLSLFGLGRGLLPEPFETTVGSAAATAILGTPVEMHLKLWHGVDPAALTVMGLSLLTLALGGALYLMIRHRAAPVGPFLRRACSVGPTQLYDLSLRALYTGADGATRFVQSGRLRFYVTITVAFALLAVAPPLWRAMTWQLPVAPEGWRLHEILVVLVGMLATLTAAFLRSRLATLAVIGATGTCVALIFVLFSAPDLALTQVMIEVLTVVLLVMVLYRLPRVVPRSSGLSRLRDLIVATAAGLTMTLFVLAVAPIARDTSVSEFYLQNSAPMAFGRNVVNVILVDFRALDTLGEITVLGTAGLGVFALMRLGVGRRKRKESR